MMYPPVTRPAGENPTGIPPKILLSGRYYFSLGATTATVSWLAQWVWIASDDQRSEDSAIRFSPASLTNSKKFVCVTSEGLLDKKTWDKLFTGSRGWEQVSCSLFGRRSHRDGG
jgi:hypothetical protein